MQDGGWLKIPRALRNHSLWRDPSRLRAWLDLLMTAQYDQDRPKTVLINGRAVEVGYAEVACSSRFLAMRWGWSRSKVERFLEYLEGEKMISISRAGSHRVGEPPNEPNIKKVLRTGENKTLLSQLPPEVRDLSDRFHAERKKQHPTLIKEVTLKRVEEGAKVIHSLVRQGHDLEAVIKPVLRWAVRDPFWDRQVLSLASLKSKSPRNGETKWVNLLAAYEASMQGGHGTANHPDERPQTMYPEPGTCWLPDFSKAHRSTSDAD